MASLEDDLRDEPGRGAARARPAASTRMLEESGLRAGRSGRPRGRRARSRRRVSSRRTRSPRRSSAAPTTSRPATSPPRSTATAPSSTTSSRARIDRRRPRRARRSLIALKLRAMEAPPYSAAAVDVVRLPAGATERDRVAVEEPLEIRIGGAAGRRHDAHARARRGARARLLPLRGPAAGERARCPTTSPRTRSTSTRRGFDPARLQRSFYTSSSCGVCGKGALEAVAVEAPRVDVASCACRSRSSSSLPDRLREAQAAFAATGGLHATGLFAAGRRAALRRARTSAGTTRSTRSSAGRSSPDCCRSPSTCSASAAGSRSSSCRRRRSPAARSSSRSARRRASRSSSRRDRGITLCGFVRGGSVNVYTEPWRIRPDGDPARRRREHAVRLAEGARRVEGETLAERAWRLLGEACEERHRRRPGRSCFRSRLPDRVAAIARRACAPRAHELCGRDPGGHAAAHGRLRCARSPTRVATPRCRRPGRSRRVSPGARCRRSTTGERRLPRRPRRSSTPQSSISTTTLLVNVNTPPISIGSPVTRLFRVGERRVRQASWAATRRGSRRCSRTSPA